MARKKGTCKVEYFALRTDTLPKDDQVIEEIKHLAYMAAHSKKKIPKIILFRSGCHDTTSINGVYWKDPKGSHYTFSYKEQAQIDRNSHETFHIYVSGPDDWTMGEVTHYVEQYDDLRLHRGNNPWPTAEGALTHVGSMEFQLRLRLCVRLCVNSLEAGSLLLADRSCIYYDRRIVNLVYTNPE